MGIKLKYLFIAMRPYQWVKNFFIFMPLVFGQHLFERMGLLKTLATFFLFSFAASGVYLANDILDLEGDKKHPTKRHRPIASGLISIRQSKVVAIILICSVIFFSFILDKNICWIIIIYCGLNLLYTLKLKDAVILDVFCIGAFYYFRILAGSLSGNVVLSNWMILCTILLALFLAFGKRRYDLQVSRGSKPVYLKYNIYFIDRMISIISGSLVVFYALYTMDQHTINQFQTRNMIYTIPFVYYGIFRYLYLIDKKQIGGDPTLILLKDKKMQMNLLLWIVTCITILYFPSIS